MTDRTINQPDAWEKVGNPLKKGDVRLWDYTDPEDNESIVGMLRQVETGVGKYKGTVYTIMTQDYGMMKFWGCTDLDQKMSEVRVGDEVKILRRKTQVSKEGRQFYTFDVYRRDIV